MPGWLYAVSDAPRYFEVNKPLARFTPGRYEISEEITKQFWIAAHNRCRDIVAGDVAVDTKRQHSLPVVCIVFAQSHNVLRHSPSVFDHAKLLIASTPDQKMARYPILKSDVVDGALFLNRRRDKRAP